MRSLACRLPVLVLATLLAISSMVGLLARPASAAETADAPVSSVAEPFVNQSFQLTGVIGTAEGRKVTLQYYTSRWKDAQTQATGSKGSYDFRASTSKAERKFRVVAAKTAAQPAVESEAVTIETREDAVNLVLSRNRTTGLANGTAKTAVSGRKWALQVKKSGWTQVGDKVVEGKDGTISASFPLASGSYRLVGDPVVEGLAGAVSDSESFSTGPKSLGKHVMFLTTDSGATPKTKGKDYPGTAGLDDAAPLPLETVAVRGNSSATYDKKPYKVKFVDSTSPFGLPRGKTFILLTNFQDHSLVRGATGLTLAGQLDGLPWTPHRVFTEVFMNGQYRGSYELIESIKIQQASKKNDARVPIDAETGVIVEINPADDAPGEFKGKHGMSYGFKDPDEVKKDDDGTLDPEGVTPAKTAGMKAKITKFESVLYGKSYKDPVNGWRKYLDMDSAVDFYLENEFVKNWDGDFFLSTYFYTDDYADPDAKLVMGPIWDLDRTAACKTSGSSTVTSPKGWWLDGSGTGHGNQPGDVHDSHWFTRITDDPAFQKALEARWAEKKGTFKAVGKTGIDAMVAELGKDVAANDRALWQGKQPKGRYLPRAKSYSGEISFLEDWYSDRYAWMNSKLG